MNLCNDEDCFCSVLPEDERFAEIAQIAIKMLTGKGNFEILCPTASSVISHGSN